MEYIVRCPICGQIVAIGAIGSTKKQIHQVHGFCYELGYSIGGWGHRQDFIPKFAAEICDDCFQEINPKILELEKLIENMKDSRRDELLIYTTKLHNEQETVLQTQAHHNRKSSWLDITRKVTRFLGKHEG